VHDVGRTFAAKIEEKTGSNLVRPRRGHEMTFGKPVVTPVKKKKGVVPLLLQRGEVVSGTPPRTNGGMRRGSRGNSGNPTLAITWSGSPDTSEVYDGA